MSEAGDSALDHLVNEVIEGRERVEAESAPDPVPAEETQVPSEDQPESDEGRNGVSIGFAGNGEAVDPEAPSDPAPSDVAIIDGEELTQLREERDGYLADSQRLAADFANFRKQSEKRVSDAAAVQSAGLVRDLIPVLDACDSALIQDAESAAGPIRSALITELEKNGLELLAPPEGEVFDPEMHEAVMHEPAAADSEAEGPIVAEVFRSGYTWKGRVVRPAMVKVIG